MAHSLAIAKKKPLGYEHLTEAIEANEEFGKWYIRKLSAHLRGVFRVARCVLRLPIPLIRLIA
jgi:hypothetical protein